MYAFLVVLIVVIVALASAKKAPLLSRIINGEAAVKDEIPYQLMLRYNGQFRCGATLISQQWAITAGHCVGGEDSLYTVRVNHNDVSSSDYDEYRVSRVIRHEMYNSGSGAYPNNIALLLLSTGGADLSENVISVAAGSYDFAGDSCVISGYGVTESGSTATTLMKASVRVLSHESCQNSWGSNIADQHACVEGLGPNGAAACNGDSGGPLVCSGVLAGVTSWGSSGCHENGVVQDPSVYTRMTHFRNWINNNCNCL